MNDLSIWLTIIFLGIGTYLIRYSFIGFFADKKLPDWLLRHLRYVPAAVMPGLVAPLTVWPEATGGDPDPARLIAAAVALLIGAILRSVLGAIFGGMGMLYLMQYLLA
ncbi:MAG: AzlD domain-containing protein [Rhodobacteraceae bacterium]|nr:AzlD domain-containing protein [Paracoccaceae bacterium]